VDKNEKNGKQQFNFIDKVIKHEYKGNVENIYKSLIVHAKMKYETRILAGLIPE
jgi:hypothetical protein